MKLTWMCAVAACFALQACNGTDVETPQAQRQVGAFATSSTRRPVYPTRLAASADLVFVTDAQGDAVFGLKADGSAAFVLEGMARPLGLAVSGDLLYVGSAGRKSVEVYSIEDHRFLRYLGNPGAWSMPSAIAVAPDGMVYVADSSRDVIGVFAANGKAQPSIGGSGSKDGQLRFPAAIAVDDTRVVVGDQGNHRVQIFDRQGRFQKSFGAALTTDVASRQQMAGRFSQIQGIALHGDAIHVLDSYHSHVQVFDANGKCLGAYGARSDFVLGLDLLLGRPGVALISDPEHHRVIELSTVMGWTP